MALYDPVSGYYSRPAEERIGKSGDFITSVSTGDTFGWLLGHGIMQFWCQNFPNDPIVIVEQGADDGQLAEDILKSIEQIDPARFLTARYLIIEKRDTLKKRIEERFSDKKWATKIELVEQADGIREKTGVFLCNELLDALPVKRLRFRNGKWVELGVSLGAEGLVEKEQQLTDDWENSWLADLGKTFPEGYETEHCPEISPWVESISQIFEQGLWWVIDYGHEKTAYYAPSRRQGTLRCFSQHAATEDALDRPGEQDITAHVDWTLLRDAAIKAGLEESCFQSQAAFLTKLAAPWLKSIDGAVVDPLNQKRIRQFQTLTHPSMMGQVFEVMELKKGDF